MTTDAIVRDVLCLSKGIAITARHRQRALLRLKRAHGKAKETFLRLTNMIDAVEEASVGKARIGGYDA